MGTGAAPAALRRGCGEEEQATRSGKFCSVFSKATRVSRRFQSSRHSELARNTWTGHARCGQLYCPNQGVNSEPPFGGPEFLGDVIVVNGKSVAISGSGCQGAGSC